MTNNIENCLPKGTILHGKTYDYEIRRALGQGSFGITYLAAMKVRGELRAINATVAIKEFFMHEINGRNRTSVTSGSKIGVYDKYKQKFIKEAQHLGSLKHENIVKVIESFEQNNTVYYSMEYIDGGNLDDYIKQKGHLGENETLEFATQIASAMLFMHSKNMLHLDLKPSNIMIRKEDRRIVLIDFGLSKQYDDSGNPESSTTIGAGTFGYAPLEQANYKGKDKGTLPVTMDVYALGGTMFKMLTGKTPPVASDILNDGFPEEYLLAKGISSNVVNFIVKAMSPLRKNRIANMQSFMDSLRVIRPQESEATVFHVENSDETVLDTQKDTKSNFEQYVGKRSANTFSSQPHKVSSSSSPVKVYTENEQKKETQSNFGEYVRRRNPNKINENANEKNLNDNLSTKRNVTSWWQSCLHWVKFMFYFILVVWMLWGGGVFDKCSNNEETIEHFTDLSNISIGDYLYADGTYTHVLDTTNIDKCSGCVYNLETSEIEKNEGWNIGHIVALKDAVDRNGKELLEWGPENTSIPSHVNYKDAIKEKDGYWACLMDSACFSPSICSLYDFDGVVFNVPLPNNSRWFVPTVSDWRDIIVNLGKVTINEESSSLFIYDNKMASKEIYQKIKAFPQYIGPRKGDEEDYSYWTCIQQGSGYLPSDDEIVPRAWAIYAYSYSDVGHIGNSPTRNKMKVRPVAAF